MGSSAIPPETRDVLYAAVVMPVVRHDEPALVFVRRASHLRRNPGQIAFPGGLVDAADADPRATASREFEEELGIARERLRIVDRFTDVVTLVRTVTVTPYLGFLQPPADFAPDGRETESVHLVPLAALYVPGALRHGTEATEYAGRAIEVPSWLFDHGNLHVWGATARMLASLVSRYATAAAVIEAAD